MDRKNKKRLCLNGTDSIGKPVVSRLQADAGRLRHEGGGHDQHCQERRVGVATTEGHITRSLGDDRSHSTPSLNAPQSQPFSALLCPFSGHSILITVTVRHHHLFVYECGHDAAPSAVSIKLVLPTDGRTDGRTDGVYSGGGGDGPAPAVRGYHWGIGGARGRSEKC